jgi:hypothetical protein
MWFLAIGEIAVRSTSREPECSARMMIKLMAILLEAGRAEVRLVGIPHKKS